MAGSRLVVLILVYIVASLVIVCVGDVNAQSSSLTAQERLGKAIFFDKNLSMKRNQSCSSCHDPAWGWSGPNSEINAAGSVYEGSVRGEFGNRKPTTAAYATLSPIFHTETEGNDTLFIGGNFWDGRATGEQLGNPAADQAQGPFLNAVEQALPTPDDVVARVCVSDYASLFKQVWGVSACAPTNVEQAYDFVALSIAAFESSAEVNAFTSKYDYYLAGLARLTQQEARGLVLFQSRALCSNCHPLDRGTNGEPPLFTDFTYDNLGIPPNPANPVYIGNPTFIDPGLGGFLATRPEHASFAQPSNGMHKVPTLRNVDKRPHPGSVKAYGHNGYFKTLEGVVHFYNTRDVLPRCPAPYTEAEALAHNCWPAPEVADNVNMEELGNLQLSQTEEEAIVAFLKTLSDGYSLATGTTRYR